MGEDPIGFEGGDATLYRYSGNDPQNSVDPNGLEKEERKRYTFTEVFWWFAKNFWGGAWIPDAAASAPEAAKETVVELVRLYGDAKDAELDREILERRLKDLKTPEDYKRLYGDQWKQALEQTERLAKVGFQANLIVGGLIIRPGTVMASGCDDVAAALQEILGENAIKIRIVPKKGRWLGSFVGKPVRWAYHHVVVKGGRVYDAYTGVDGMPIEAYKALFENAADIEFGF